MVVITISGILAILGAGISSLASVGGFLANVAFLPFKIAGDNKLFAVVIYWIVFFIDSFIVVQLFSAIMQPFFDIFGITGVEIGFTSIYLILINMFTVFLLGWYFVPFHLLMLASAVLALQFAIWTYSKWAILQKM
ncbi:hypothetical protein LCGC14_0978920 [marine sediment metagenome]|uniref:Uncharacterized protein n=1 Tax=marine sediment metagenome TaxID=412755 RepID=A0A0F9N9E7_9ZZZZ|nr:hypothetical protein [bacterium]